MFKCTVGCQNKLNQNGHILHGGKAYQFCKIINNGKFLSLPDDIAVLKRIIQFKCYPFLYPKPHNVYYSRLTTVSASLPEC